MKGRNTSHVILLLSALFTGCGGGGGGGGDGAMAPLALDPNNAMPVAAVVLEAVALVQDLDMGGVVPPAPAAAVVAREPDDSLPSPPPLSQIIREQIDHFQLLHNPPGLIRIAAVQIPPTTLDCLVWGTMTVSGNIADDLFNVFTPGDTLRATYNDCNNGDGIVLNGTMDIMVVTGVDTDFTPPYDFTFDTNLARLSVTEIASGESFTANGDLTLREAVSADGLFIQSEASGTKLTATGDGETVTLRDYWIGGTLDLGAGEAYTADSGGVDDCCATLESTVIGGAVDFENTTRFDGIGDNFPYSGRLFITGETGASGLGPTSTELIALDVTCVDLVVDQDGDGADDAVIRTSWESLPGGVPDNCLVQP